MQLGLFLSYQVNRPADIDGIYERMIDAAIAADESGFTRVWAPEHHLVQFLPAPSALLLASNLAQHVSCRVGTAAVVLPFHEPLRLAGEIAATDQLMDGRLDLGVARGAYKYEFEGFGIPFGESRDRFIETLTGLEAIWHNPDEPAEQHGEHISFNRAYVWPRPRQQPGPPVWVAAQSPPAVEDAAARGYHVLNSLFLWDVEHMRNVVASFREGQRRGGATANHIGITRYAFICPDDAAVWRNLEELREGWRIHQQLHDFSQNADECGIVRPQVQAEEPTLEAMRERLLVGTYEEVLDKTRLYRDAGVDILNLNVTFGADQEQTIRAIQQFGKLRDDLLA
ncbi:LLM class flavin-dependent oxidoreductase [Egibacter rhizosphaerae]|uniref:LLM class flavin-dependent oxidoreductase n=1 Tax=Egibacter rhizosphaerae TaxID=1670831 RepID=A0A411YHI9_9ACTN|nr:LLM class flavin-dependent oxidoreductase [Egibacter rhizosphaerae]QBI20542.1 LLM class flavin-dependent oxidoreductase [Egibacter rhizosphaerae]